MTSAQRRQTMINSQLRTVGVIDPAVLAAMAEIPREDFLPPALRGLAYADAALEIAVRRWLLEPMVLALLLQNARVVPGDKILVIGAAGGYTAAVLRHMGASVVAVESDPGLLELARTSGTDVMEAPLVAGHAAAAPYDLILFEGAIETVPAAIAAQLQPHGRVAAVVRDGGIGRASVGPLVTGPGGSSRIGGLPFLEVAAKPLPGFEWPRAFAF
ncbi:protein-L-isoaspartate O-methyltransferase family protein [Sandarakinorhabdus sp. DWP1-3-1]|uniref:protein-L-isoaspartate O-methyltransferase family protein n=1 Tax=Sandarakinorhabdus sp. DWP1-3-1 TaxID=2804627 RepID=UPI003CFABE9A